MTKVHFGDVRDDLPDGGSPRWFSEPWASEDGWEEEIGESFRRLCEERDEGVMADAESWSADEFECLLRRVGASSKSLELSFSARSAEARIRAEAFLLEVRPPKPRHFSRWWAYREAATFLWQLEHSVLTFLSENTKREPQLPGIIEILDDRWPVDGNAPARRRSSAVKNAWCLYWTAKWSTAQSINWSYKRRATEATVKRSRSVEDTTPAETAVAALATTRASRSGWTGRLERSWDLWLGWWWWLCWVGNKWGRSTSGDIGWSEDKRLGRNLSDSVSSEREFLCGDGEDVTKELDAESGVGIVGRDARLRRFRGAMSQNHNFVFSHDSEPQGGSATDVTGGHCFQVINGLVVFFDYSQSNHASISFSVSDFSFLSPILKAKERKPNLGVQLHTSASNSGLVWRNKLLRERYTCEVPPLLTTKFFQTLKFDLNRRLKAWKCGEMGETMDTTRDTDFGLGFNIFLCVCLWSTVTMELGIKIKKLKTVHYSERLYH